MNKRIEKLDNFIEMDDIELMEANGGAGIRDLILKIAQLYGKGVADGFSNDYQAGRKSYSMVKAIADGTFNYNRTYC